MKQLIILTAIMLGFGASAQAATRPAAALICDNNGRCVQQIAPARILRTHARKKGGGRYSHAAVQRRPRRAIDANGNAALVTVSTAANVNITVAPRFADPIKGFIADLVARGYTPRRIGCYSWAASHVARSLHHTGEACDFDQRGWGRTVAAMYHVADLAKKWGLRNGCSFGDCGHIDNGRLVVGERKPWPRIMAARSP